jgi:hypothetical protein
MVGLSSVGDFVAHWRETGGSELANTQSFINWLCALIGVPAPRGSRSYDAFNTCVFERRVFQNNGYDTMIVGHINAFFSAVLNLIHGRQTTGKVS